MSNENVVEAADADLRAFLDLDLEYRLTVAVRLSEGNCGCPRYFVERREVLIPEIMKVAKKRGEEPIEVFHQYAVKIHAAKCEED